MNSIFRDLMAQSTRKAFHVFSVVGVSLATVSCLPLINTTEIFQNQGSSSPVIIRDKAGKEIVASRVHNDGWKLFKAGDLEGSIEKYEIAIEVGEREEDPYLYHYYNNRAWSKFKMGNFKGALADVNESLALNPEYPNAIDTKEKTIEGICQSWIACNLLKYANIVL